MKPILAVDWDGTCVEHVWPDEGDWLPGAVDALHSLTDLYEIHVFSCRVAPFEFLQPDTPRPEEDTEREIAYIRRMLDEVYLQEVQIWTRPFKIPAVAYVDDRGIRFNNNWEEVVGWLRT